MQNSEEWDVPYLPIDPADVGASYEAVIGLTANPARAAFPILWRPSSVFRCRVPCRLSSPGLSRRFRIIG